MNRLKFVFTLAAIAVLVVINDSRFGDTKMGIAICLGVLVVIALLALSTVFDFTGASKKSERKAREQLQEAMGPLEPWPELAKRALELVPYLSAAQKASLEYESRQAATGVTNVFNTKVARTVSLKSRRKLSARRERRIIVADCREVTELAIKASYYMVALERRCDELEPRVLIARKIEELIERFEMLRSLETPRYPLPDTDAQFAAALIGSAQHLFDHDKFAAADEKAVEAEAALERLVDHLSSYVVDSAKSLLKPQ